MTECDWHALAGFVIGWLSAAIVRAAFGVARRRQERAVLRALKSGNETGIDISRASGVGILSVYVVLGRLESRGLVSSRYVEPELGLPRRRVYHANGPEAPC